VRIAITGIGGFIGRRFAERAVARGDQVVGLERDPRAAAEARRAGHETQEGDVADRGAAQRLVQGADVVFHTAAVVAEGGPPEPYRRVNVHGTRVMVEAARAAGVQRFVHLSSVMVYGFDYPELVGEEGPVRGEGNPYCQTKIESELAAHDARGTMPMTVVRPGDVYGPGSVPWVVRPLGLLRQGLFVLPTPGGVINHVHVDNLCDAVFLAVDQGVDGTFNVSDGVGLPIEQYFGRLAAMIGKTVRVLPAPLLTVAFAGAEQLFDRLGKEPPARADAVRFLQRPHAVSIARARERLGYRPRISFADGMDGVERWVRDQASGT